VAGRLGQARAIPIPMMLDLTLDDAPVSQVHFHPDGTGEAARLIVHSPAHPGIQIAVDETTGHVAIQPASLPAPRR
jgi:hypothetical protein